jgi:uncharacterized membrane protein
MFIVPSFIFSQEKKIDTITVQKLSKDSVTVNINFQNPEVIVTDSRSSGVLEKKLDSTTATNEKLINVINTLSQDFGNVVTLQKEVRGASAIDRIEQSTGYSEEQIKEVFAQERMLNLVYGICTLIFIIACLIIYVTSFERYRGLTAVLLLVCFLIYVGILLASKYIFPQLFGVNYQQFFQLLKYIPV